MQQIGYRIGENEILVTEVNTLMTAVEYLIVPIIWRA